MCIINDILDLFTIGGNFFGVAVIKDWYPINLLIYINNGLLLIALVSIRWQVFKRNHIKHQCFTARSIIIHHCLILNLPLEDQLVSAIF